MEGLLVNLCKNQLSERPCVFMHPASKSDGRGPSEIPLWSMGPFGAHHTSEIRYLPKEFNKFSKTSFTCSFF